MGTADENPKKSSAQKGQGMLEYALMMSFVAMVYLIVFADGGFSGAITGTFDNASETLVMASEKNISGDFGSGGSASGGSSSASSNGLSSRIEGSHTVEEIISENFIATHPVQEDKTEYSELDWYTLNRDIKLTFETIINGTDPYKAIASEYNLFYQLSAMTTAQSNTKEYIYHNGQAIGWNDLLAQIGNQTAGKSTSSYKKDSETLKINRTSEKVDGNTINKIVMTYDNGKSGNDNVKKVFSLYAEKPDGGEKQVMKFKSEVTSEGTTTPKSGTDAIKEYGALSSEVGIYTPNTWQFDK